MGEVSKAGEVSKLRFFPCKEQQRRLAGTGKLRWIRSTGGELKLCMVT